MPRLRYGVAPLGRLAGARVLLGRLLPPHQRHRPALEETECGMTLTADEQYAIHDSLVLHRPEFIGYATRETRSCSTNSTPQKRQLPVTTSMTTPSAPCSCSSGTSSRPVPSPAPRSSSGRPGRSSGGSLVDMTAPPRGYPAPGPALNIYPRRRRSPIARLIRIITKGH